MSLRPSILDPLFAPANTLPGVGPKIAPLLDRLLGEPGRPARVADLLFHVPTSGIARELKGSIADAPVGEPVTLAVTVTAHRAPAAGPPGALQGARGGRDRRRHAGVLQRPQGPPGEAPAARRAPLRLGQDRDCGTACARWSIRTGFSTSAALATLPAVEAIYGLTEGLSSRMVGRYMARRSTRCRTCPNGRTSAWLEAQRPARLSTRRSRPSTARTMPRRSPTTCSPNPSPRRRLAYDELLASQLALALVRSRMRRLPGRVNAGDGRLVAKRLKRGLPFGLTGSQEQAVEDIRRDLVSDKKMLRLLQGDVGSGKTVVGLLAMASAIEAGRQAATDGADRNSRAPAFRAHRPDGRAGRPDDRAVDRTRQGRERRAVLAGLDDGRIQIAVGTHALFQEGVAFRDLGVAVVDEQHRFGVHQRLALGAKGEAVDILVMTATPIPRTLALTYFGDMDVSVLNEKPAGRKPIATKLISIERLDEVVGGIGRAIAERRSGLLGLSARGRIRIARSRGRRGALRDSCRACSAIASGSFTASSPAGTRTRRWSVSPSGETKILVSTTVIEVGVDVPDATVMVIEHAERFGLSQLHQLRGRIGRGSRASTCLLLYKGPLGQTAQARLEMMRETEDGFRIAEEDLRLRGEGEVLGTRQSGMPGFKLARLEVRRRPARRRARRCTPDRRSRPRSRKRARSGLARAALSVRARFRDQALRAG